MNRQPARAAQIISGQKQRLVQLQSDLAVLDEQRESVKQQIAALRNYLNGVSLGERNVHELQKADAEDARAEACEAAERAEAYGSADGTD